MDTMDPIDNIWWTTRKFIISCYFVFFTSQITFEWLVTDKLITCLTRLFTTWADVIIQILTERSDDDISGFHKVLFASSWLPDIWNRDENLCWCLIVDFILKRQAWWQNCIISWYKTFLRWSCQCVFWHLAFRLSLMNFKPSGVFTHFPTATYNTRANVKRIGLSSCSRFRSGSWPRTGRPFATAHPPLLSGSARGIILFISIHV